MSAPRGPAGRSRRAAVQLARLRAADLARDHGTQVAEALRYAAPGLVAIRDRVRAAAGRSARVRALALEFLPDARYLDGCVVGLRFRLRAVGSRRTLPADVQERIDELQAAFDRTIELSTTIDIAGELDLPFDLVVAVQTGARAGLSALHRLRDALDAAQADHLDVVDDRPADATRSAQWLVRAASRMLPAAGRERYLEEFSSELRELADTGTGRRGQLAHALRLAALTWSLRAALPAEPRPATTDRVHVPATPRPHHPPATRLARRRARTWRSTAVGRWLTQRDSRRLALRTVRTINRSSWAPSIEPASRTRREGDSGRHRAGSDEPPRISWSR